MREKQHTPKEKATLYQATKDVPELCELEETPTQDRWLNVVEQQVAEAIQQGDFENLPGQGKPLDFSDDSLVPDDQRLAYKLLKNNDLTPTWIGERSDIQTKIDHWRITIQSQFVHYQARWETVKHHEEQSVIQKLWSSSLEQHQAKLQEINSDIRTLNLQQPIVSLEFFHLQMEKELEQLAVYRTLGGL